MTEDATTSDPFSSVAADQLDALEVNDPDLCADVLAVCNLVFTDPGRAQSASSAIQTPQGIRFRLAVPGRHPYNVFWSSDGANGSRRIEAVFPHP